MTIADWLPPPEAVGVVTDEYLAERKRREDEIDRAARLVQFVRTLPAAYRWAHFDAPELAQRVPAAGIAQGRTLIDAPRIVLFGPPGSGKTSLATAMLRAWWEAHGGGARFVHAHRLGTARIQHHAGDGEADEVQAAIRAYMVLLDDVGDERMTATNALPDVVYERHAEGRPYWVTTGLTVEQLAERYGGGVARRLLEGATVVRLSPRR